MLRVIYEPIRVNNTGPEPRENWKNKPNTVEVIKSALAVPKD